MIISYVVYACTVAGFLWADSKTALTAMFALYGVFYAMDEGQAKAYLADISDDEARGTAIGLYGFITGLVYLPASLIAGVLWSYGPAWTFAFAIGTSLGAIGLFLYASVSSTLPEA